MMKRTAPVIVGVVLVFVTVLAQQTSLPDGSDGYGLQKNLQGMERSGYSYSDAYDSAYALGYIVGVADSLDGVPFCVPGNVRQGEIKAVVLKYLSDHPEQLHKGWVTVVTAALKGAFPCQNPESDRRKP